MGCPPQGGSPPDLSERRAGAPGPRKRQLSLGHTAAILATRAPAQSLSNSLLTTRARYWQPELLSRYYLTKSLAILFLVLCLSSVYPCSEPQVENMAAWMGVWDVMWVTGTFIGTQHYSLILVPLTHTIASLSSLHGTQHYSLNGIIASSPLGIA